MEDEIKQPINDIPFPEPPVVPVQPTTETAAAPSTPEVTTLPPETIPVVTPPEPEAPALEGRPVIVRTFEDDLARSMNVSDAKTVQELLTSAREREAVMKEEAHKKVARGWYTTGAIILLLAAIAAGAYSIYHYNSLTVPVAPALSVGVFPGTASIVANTTTVETVLTELSADPTLIDGKPYLVDLVADEKTNVLLNNTQLFSFIGATPTEPFATSLGVIRLGVMNTATDTVPFLIASLPNPEIANKEFLIAEPKMLSMFSRALAIDTSTIAPETNPAFVGEYRYNVPVRALYSIHTSGARELTLLYGSATDTVVVITTKPEILKAIYDTLIRQL